MSSDCQGPQQNSSASIDEELQFALLLVLAHLRGFAHSAMFYRATVKPPITEKEKGDLQNQLSIASRPCRLIYLEACVRGDGGRAAD